MVPSASTASVSSSSRTLSPQATIAASTVLGLLAGLIGAWIYDHSSASKAPTEAASSEGGKSATLSAAEGASLKSQIGDIEERLSGLRSRVDDLPKSAPDLSALQSRVDELVKTTDNLSPLADRVKGIDARLEPLDSSVKRLSGDLTAVKKNVAALEKNATSAATGANDRRPATETGADSGVGDEPMSQGVDSFKKGHYQEAYDIFQRMEQTNPDDARVWYYAALSRGLATSQWNEGETLHLVEKGIEREKAGTPKPAQIDLMFQGLTTNTGKDWLAEYRKRVKAR